MSKTPGTVQKSYLQYIIYRSLMCEMMWKHTLGSTPTKKRTNNIFQDILFVIPFSYFIFYLFHCHIWIICMHTSHSIIKNTLPAPFFTYSFCSLFHVICASLNYVYKIIKQNEIKIEIWWKTKLLPVCCEQVQAICINNLFGTAHDAHNLSFSNIQK